MQGLLIKYGEIALRGKNRHLFENKVIDMLQRKLPQGHVVKKEQGRILVIPAEGDTLDYDAIIPIAKNILGITYVCPCDIIESKDMADIKTAVVAYMNKHYTGEFTFKVESKRSDKSYPFTSPEMNQHIGGAVLAAIPGAKVDVNQPDAWVHVELRTHVYVFSKMIKAVGGLPQVGGGKALVLLSGGIDSPVAAYLTARRGVEVDAIYFHAPPYTSEHARQKVVDLAQRVAYYTGNVKLHIVNFTPLQLFLYEKLDQEKLTIHLKRAMVRIAQRVARDMNAQAIVLGDSVGQVASQTIYSMQAIDAAGDGLPILRPLAAMDKQDIIDISETIETYPISILPYEDCCTIFVAKRPTTRPLTSAIEKAEAKYQTEIDQFIQEAIDTIEVLKIR